VFPLKVSADKRRLIDQRGQPFFVNGDTPWSLITGLTREDAELYLEDRKQRGFNAILMNIIEHKFNGPVNRYGQGPFLKSGDFSAPNEQYFQHVDWVIGRARDKGMLVLATPAYFGYQGGDEGWYQEIIRTSLSILQSYGRYLGSRYKQFDNIVWVMGGDHGSNAGLPYTRAIVQGLQETDQPRVFTAHNSRFESGIKYHESESWFSLNTTYSDCNNSAANSLTDYNRSPVIPFLYFEGRYENEGASAVCIRSQAYWAVLAGANGHFLGVKPVWSFDAGWKQTLDTNGSRSMTRFARLFLSRAWHKLVPDQSGTLLTGGRGSLETDVAGAAITSDGTTAIIYAPSSRGLTISMSKISGSTARAWWYNPETGLATRVGDFPTTGSRTFTPPGGDDWVLILDDASLNLPAPG
jgi:hypothetical protein